MQPDPAAYFLYHSIGQYPGKADDLAAATAEFARAWGAFDDRQWGYALKKRQRFIDLMVNAFRENRRALRRLKMLLAEPHYAAALVMGRRKGRQGRT